MVLNGSNVDTSNKKRSSSALTIAQLLQFHTVQQKSKSKSSEKPLPRYMGLMVHSRIRMKSLIEELNEYGLSTSYKRILAIQNSMVMELETLSFFDKKSANL